MRDPATQLLELIEAAEKLTARPAAIERERELVELHIELEETSAFTAVPCGGLLIDVEALLLAQVVCLAAKQRRMGDHVRARLLQQLAGVLLPPVREAASRAIEFRRDTRATP